MQELGCKCMNLEVVTRKHRSKGNMVNTVLRRRRCRPVIVFSQQSSDSEPSMPKALDVKVQILDALPCAPFTCTFPNVIQFGGSSATPGAWKRRPPACLASTHCPVMLICWKYMSAH